MTKIKLMLDIVRGVRLVLRILSESPVA